jgi:hypothetical protein
VGGGGGFRKPLEIRLLEAIPLRRLLPAAATHGHRVGHAALDDDNEVASSFFLHERIFRSVAVASKSPAQPSGFVPDWDWGDSAVTKQAAGEFSGPDRVCKAIYRAQAIKVRGMVVFSYFLGGLLVKLYPPLNL